MAKLTKKDKDLHEEFYTMCKMVGVVEEKGNKFTVVIEDGPAITKRLYTGKSKADAKVAEQMGGRNSTLKLLRHCEMLTVVCQLPGYENVFGTINGHFARIVELYPILRGYYEQAKIGGDFHTWYSYKRV